MRILNCEFSDRVKYIPNEKPSVKEIKIDGKRIIFDVNSLLAVQVADDEVEEVLSGRADSVLDDKMHCRLKPQFPFYSGGKIGQLCLIATHGCNLKCRYCYVHSRGGMVGGGMDFETARQAILYFYPARSKHRISVGFFGGEPLLNWELIEKVTEFVKFLAGERGVNWHVGLTTNGTLLSPKKIDYLDKNGFSMILSLDGDRETHNFNRPMEDGDSFEKTRGAIQSLRGTGLAGRTVLRSTFTPDCIKLRERLEFLNDVAGENGLAGVACEPATLSEASCIAPDSNLIFTKEHFERLEKEYHEASEWFVTEVAKGNRPTFRHYEKVMEKLCRAEHKATECGAAKGYVTVSPDGTLYACHREGDTKVGHLAYGFDEELRAKWMDNRFYERPCVKCWAQHICGGGCRYNAIHCSGDIRKPDPISCFFMKLWIKECLWIMTQLNHGQLTELYPTKEGK